MPEKREPSTLVLLVRHGENDWVKSNRLAGRTPGVHLNEKGRAQSRRLAARLASWPIAAVYSSPMERCHETAVILARPHGLPVIHRDALLEADYGDWQGQEIDKLLKTDLWKVIQAAPSFARFPGGERMIEMQFRVVEALHDIVDAHPNEVVLVCSHADLIKAALSHFAGAHFDMFQRLHIDPASLSIIKFGRHGPRILRINDTGELPPPQREE